MAYIVMAYIHMAYIVMARQSNLRRPVLKDICCCRRVRHHSLELLLIERTILPCPTAAPSQPAPREKTSAAAVFSASTARRPFILWPLVAVAALKSDGIPHRDRRLLAPRQAPRTAGVPSHGRPKNTYTENSNSLLSVVAQVSANLRNSGQRCGPEGL